MCKQKVRKRGAKYISNRSRSEMCAIVFFFIAFYKTLK